MEHDDIAALWPNAKGVAAMATVDYITGFGRHVAKMHSLIAGVRLLITCDHTGYLIGNGGWIVAV